MPSGFQKANEALDWRTPAYTKRIVRATSQSRAANITVLNSSATLPDSFVKQDWEATSGPFLLPPCLIVNAKCEAILADLDGDGTAEILLFSLLGGISTAFQSTKDGRWTILGPIPNAQCAGVRDALRASKFETVAPKFKEIEVNGQRLRVDRGCTRSNQ